MCWGRKRKQTRQWGIHLKLCYTPVLQRLQVNHKRWKNAHRSVSHAPPCAHGPTSVSRQSCWRATSLQHKQLNTNISSSTSMFVSIFPVWFTWFGCSIITCAFAGVGAIGSGDRGPCGCVGPSRARGARAGDRRGSTILRLILREGRCKKKKKVTKH